MLALILLFTMSLPGGDVAAFATRIAQAVSGAAREAASNGEVPPRTRVLLRVEGAAGQSGVLEPGSAAQVDRAVREALRREKLEPVTEGEAAYSVRVWIGLRGTQPLGVARVTNGGGREMAVLFALLPAGGASAPAGSAALEVHTRSLLSVEGQVLDVAADNAGNLFVLQPDLLRIADMNAPGMPTKAEIGIQTSAERLRDPLVRMRLRELPRELELHTAAAEIGPPPPVPVEGYAIRSFAADATMSVGNPARSLLLQIQPVAGRNYFRAAGLVPFQGIAAVDGSGRAAWALLDLNGRVQLYDTALHSLNEPAPGVFGGDLEAVDTSCAGPLVLAAGPDAAPARDRVSILRLDNERLVPYSSIEIDGAVRRLVSVPGDAGTRPSGWPAPGKAEGLVPAGATRRILAVAESDGASRVVEIELRCAP